MPATPVQALKDAIAAHETLTQTMRDAAAAAHNERHPPEPTSPSSPSPPSNTAA